MDNSLDFCGQPKYPLKYPIHPSKPRDQSRLMFYQIKLRIICIRFNVKSIYFQLRFMLTLSTLHSGKKPTKKHIGFCPIQIWVNVKQDANDVTGHQAHWVTFGRLEEGKSSSKANLESRSRFGIKWREKSIYTGTPL